ncbi:MAG: hypothetical protein IPO90_02640 [Flavobacteriales bacterium]|nr:hypothetical protein [Flavobacteriales bacterium]
MAPASASNWIKYVPSEWSTPPLTNRNQRQWIIDIDEPLRWNSYPGGCAVYNTTNSTGPSSTWSPNWATWPTVFPISPGTFINGRWTGAKSQDWFDCRNWDDAEVPIATSNVVINAAYSPSNHCVIGMNINPPTAYAASVLLTTSGAAWNLTVQNNGVLQVGGFVRVVNTSNITFSGITLLNTASITAGDLTITGNSSILPRAFFRSEFATTSAAFNGP